MAHQIRAAVTNKDVAALEKLLSLGTIDINQRLNGSTPLGLAVYFGDHRCVEKLLSAGANPDIRMAILDIQCEYQTSGAEPPLTFLVRKASIRSLELARLLLDHGANPAATDTSSFTPLFYAVVSDHLDFVRLLLRYKVDLGQQIGAHHNLEHLPLPNTILHIAYRYEVKAAHLLLKRAHDEGVLPSIRDPHGNTILHDLIKAGKTRLALSILNAFTTRRKGASARSIATIRSLVTAPNLYGETPLLFAAKSADAQLIKAIVLESCDMKSAGRVPLTDENCASKALFQQILTETDPDKRAETVDSLNLLLTSGAVANEEIWLDRDQDDIYIDMLILTTLTMKRCLETGDPILDSVKSLRRAPLALKHQSRRALRRYIRCDEDVVSLQNYPEWLKKFILFDA